MHAPLHLPLAGLACALLSTLAGAQSTATVPPEGVRLVWNDHDGDGDADALVLRAGQAPRLLAGFGDGTFEDATARVGLDGLGGVRQVLWSDLDGDDASELLALTDDGAVHLLRLDGATYVDTTRAAGLALEGVTQSVEALDVDGDARLDLHLSTSAGELLLRNAGGLRFEVLDLGLELAVAPRALPAPDEPRAVEDTGALTSGAPGAAATGVGSAPGRGAAAGSAFCWDTLEDQATGNCVSVSSLPTLGALLPLGPQLYVDAAGRVGVGTLAPGAALDVIGTVRSDAQLVSTATSGPPLVVGSSEVVMNLNADLLDGLSAAEIGVFGSQVGTSELEDGAVTAAKLAPDAVDAASVIDGSLLDADLAAGAAIAGTKVTPDFGGQDVGTTGAATFGDESPTQGHAVRGRGPSPTTRGYLGVQGAEDFDGVLVLDLEAQEVGALGVASGVSANELYGVLGVGSDAGVRGMSTTNPTANFAELGAPGTGVLAEGTTYGGFFRSSSVAGQFFGDFDGARAETDATNGYGVWGRAVASTGDARGVFGDSQSSSGTGVYGRASSSSGTTYAVQGVNSSTSGRGVYGYASKSTGFTYGVFGRSQSTSGRGVRGEATASSGTNYGVQGRTWSPNGYGIISYGSSGSTGQKNFIQPHPTDPSLEVHFTSLEGNESGTYFRGSSVLLGGMAVIEVPEAFRLVSESEELTVQLTPRGPGADLWVVSVDLETVVVRGAWDVPFDYQVNGVRRGFSEHRTLRENHAFVPELRGVPYATELPLDVRRLLVANGTLNPDFTPNEATAAALGWELADPGTEEARQAEHEAARAALDAAHAED